jgi:hypothetical protein
MFLCLRGRRKEEERSAETGGGGINKAVFISPFKGECSLPFVLFRASLLFDICIVHRILRICGWRERTLMVLDSRRTRVYKQAFGRPNGHLSNDSSQDGSLRTQEGFVEYFV